MEGTVGSGVGRARRGQGAVGVQGCGLAPLPGPERSTGRGGGRKLTFGSKQCGIAGFVTERLPIMLGRGAQSEARPQVWRAEPPPALPTPPPPLSPGEVAHLGMAPRGQRLAAALTLETELVPVLAQRAHLLSWGHEGKSGPTALPWQPPHPSIRPTQEPPAPTACLLPLGAPALLLGLGHPPSPRPTLGTGSLPEHL